MKYPDGYQGLSLQELRRIGAGNAFPGMVSDSKGTTRYSVGYDRINQSLFLILSTPIGSRMGNRRFGSKIQSLIFEPNDDRLDSLISLYVVEAIREWEPRVEVGEVDIVRTDEATDLGVIFISINYTLKGSQSDANFVFPFYKIVS